MQITPIALALLTSSAAAQQTVVGPAYRFADFDRDGLADVYALQPERADRLFKNMGDGTFADVSASVGLDVITGSRMALWQDFDGDGWLDIYVCAASGRSRLLRNESGASLIDVTVASGIAHFDGAELLAEWIDFDADGWSDLHIVTEHGDRLFRNLDGRFTAVELGASMPTASVTAVTALQMPGASALASSGPAALATPPSSNTIPAGPGPSSPLAPLTACVHSVQDVVTFGCIDASNVPALGRLYPLTSNLNVSAAGNVGIGTTSPATKLDVTGDVRASGQLVSSAIGVSPMIVSSTTKVTNLNADQLDGLDATAFTQLGQTIDGNEIAAGTITSNNLASAAVTSTKLATNAINSALIADGTITTADLADASITSSKIVNATITGPDIAPGTIDSGQLVSPMTSQVQISQGSAAFTAKVSNTGTSGIRDGLRVDVYSGSAYCLWAVNNGTAATAYAVRAQTDSPTGRAGYGEATTMGATVAYGVYGACNNTSAFGVYSEGDFGGTGAKFFIQPHPSDPSKQINFACLEGNESGTYFRGSIQVVGGVASIAVPESFRLVTEPDSLSATATAVGAPALVWVESQSLDHVVLRSNVDVKVNYVVNGTRRGFRGLETIRDNTAFVPEYRGLPFGLQYRPEHRQLLVQSGILNPDFTPNEATAARLGWKLADPWDDQHAEPMVRELIRAGLVRPPAGWIPPSQRGAAGPVDERR